MSAGGADDIFESRERTDYRFSLAASVEFSL
jgi:hypothetical protein